MSCFSDIVFDLLLALILLLHAGVFALSLLSGRVRVCRALLPFGYAALLLAHLPVEIRLLALGAELETALLTVVCSGVVGTALGMLAARLSRAPADEPAGTAAPSANGQNEAPAGAEAAPAAETPADAQTNAPDAPSDDSEGPAAEETAEETAPAADGKGEKEA